MKKIGLICNYYIINYGSALQCFATQKTVREMGYYVKALQFPKHSHKKCKNSVGFETKIEAVL